MRRAAILFLIVAAALALRLGTWPTTFANGRVYIDGPDGWYHLHRAALTMHDWPRVPQFDPMLNAPAGGRISWGPLFDGLLATLALPFGTDAALERIGALLPPLLGVLQVLAMYALVRRLRGERAALCAAAVAAVLPGVVRYTLAGALDHDPFFELCNLVALIGVAAPAAARPVPRFLGFLGSSAGGVAVVAVGLTCGILGWTGGIVSVVIVAAAALASGSREAMRAVAYGCALAAVAIAPFVVTSGWRGATFEGLSLLHEAALAGAALVCAAFARERRLAIVAAVACVAFVPVALVPFVRGMRYAAGDAPILAMVEEAQPLLKLFGTFDLRPLLIRLGLLPFAALFLLRNRLVGAWVAIVLPLALLHSRFTFSAAIALAAFAGLAIDDALRVRRRALVALATALALLPCLAAYAGDARFNLFARGNALREYEMDALCDALRAAPPGVVLAPWQFGHWIVWLAKKPVVLSPMLSVGQSEFAAGERFFFLEEPRAIRAFLDAQKVNYLIVTPEPGSIEARARIAALDPTRWLRAGRIDTAAYLRTIGARLVYAQRTDGFREVLRSRAVDPGPFGPVPRVRVYEVAR